MAFHGRGERYREPPRTQVLGEVRSGADFAEFSRAPQSFPVDNRHCFVILTMSAKYLPQGFKYLPQGFNLKPQGSEILQL